MLMALYEMRLLMEVYDVEFYDVELYDEELVRRRLTVVGHLLELGSIRVMGVYHGHIPGGFVGLPPKQDEGSLD